MEGMNRLFWVFFFGFAVIAAHAAQSVHVAVLETVSSEDASISRSEKMFLTDELRSQAAKVLPANMGFVIMTRENIKTMLPPDKSLEDCEGGCLAETGRNISAEYVAQAHIGVFAGDLAMTVELYETTTGRMLGSYTAKGSGAENLLTDIQKLSPSLFARIPGADMEAVGLQGQRDERLTGEIFKITSFPAGALVDVDGRPHPQCENTPCNVRLERGVHRFTIAKDSYSVVDTVVEVNSTTSLLNVVLGAQYGTLSIDPIFTAGIGNESDLKVYIDNTEKSRFNKLVPGEHRVTVDHPCYKKIDYVLQVLAGGEYKFDQRLVPIEAYATIEAVQDGKPQKVPVFVNGRLIGYTRYYNTIPVCADIAVGNDRRRMPKHVEGNVFEKWTYEMPSDTSSYKFLANDDSVAVSFSPIDSTQFLAGKSLYFQVLWGLGAQSMSEDYKEIDVNLDDLTRLVSVGAGLGVGALDLVITDLESSYSFAPNFMLEIQVGSIVRLGARYTHVFNEDFPSNRFTALFEVPAVYGFGMEVGYAFTSNFDDGLYVALSLRLPTWDHYHPAPDKKR